MVISLDERALSWFTTEFDLIKPFTIRLLPQYAGFGQKHRGYSLAFSAESPANPGFILEENGLTFFVEESDHWFFKDTHTSLSFNDFTQELLVQYTEEILN